MSSKLANFLAKNEKNLREDAGERPVDHAPPSASKLEGRTRLTNAAAIAVDRIVADSQHREDFDNEGLQRLAASLKMEGQLQPIRVRWDEGRGIYVIIAGERRWRAAKLAGLTTLECVISESDQDEKSILRAQVVENALREDLKPVEKAKAFKTVMDLEGLDGKGLAERLNIDPSTVSRVLALLKLDGETQVKVDAGEVAPTIAIRAITKDAGRGAKKPSSRGAGNTAARERAFKVSNGLVVTVKGRRILTAEDIERALSEAIEQGRGGRAKAA